MPEDLTYAVLLRLDADTLQVVTPLHERFQRLHPEQGLMPPQMVIKSFFRPCVPCGILIQRLQVGLQDFQAVEVHLGDKRWTADGSYLWDASMLPDGEQNMALIHLKTKVWSTITSLVSLFCEFTPNEPFSYRTNNPWQPGVQLWRSPSLLPEDLPPPVSRTARCMVMDLYRVTMQDGHPIRWEHVAAFPALQHHSIP